MVSFFSVHGAEIPAGVLGGVWREGYIEVFFLAVRQLLCGWRFCGFGEAVGKLCCLVGLSCLRIVASF